ncbi:hypothetical protein EC973_007173 [Apophysomyces ossiformis]|uniref:Uncharacterized protein n=1 Tax=Apophysomyces ossiformis TaxID=679940 RepID=A0A8H7BWA4_9FUNG|nr:hypothetical protein EC973_007173 [Apophysomyces ossiformis]
MDTSNRQSSDTVDATETYRMCLHLMQTAQDQVNNNATILSTLKSIQMEQIRHHSAHKKGRAKEDYPPPTVQELVKHGSIAKQDEKSVKKNLKFSELNSEVVTKAATFLESMVSKSHIPLNLCAGHWGAIAVLKNQWAHAQDTIRRRTKRSNSRRGEQSTMAQDIPAGDPFHEDDGLSYSSENAFTDVEDSDHEDADDTVLTDTPVLSRNSSGKRPNAAPQSFVKRRRINFPRKIHKHEGLLLDNIRRIQKQEGFLLDNIRKMQEQEALLLDDIRKKRKDEGLLLDDIRKWRRQEPTIYMETTWLLQTNAENIRQIT